MTSNLDLAKESTMFTCFFESLFGNMLTLFRGVPPHADGLPNPCHTAVICRTTDEVNLEMARTWCDAHGLVCRPADQRDPLFLPDAHSLIVDLDHLASGPSERRNSWTSYAARCFLTPSPSRATTWTLKKKASSRRGDSWYFAASIRSCSTHWPTRGSNVLRCRATQFEECLYQLPSSRRRPPPSTAQAGDPDAAAQTFPLVYGALRKLAGAWMGKLPPG